MFKPGQEIVAIRNHPSNVFKKGSILIVRDVAPAVCNCMDYLVDIGQDLQQYFLLCKCNEMHHNPSGIWWFSNLHFVPIDSLEGTLLLENEENMVMISNKK